jgi:hypothetical protein
MAGTRAIDKLRKAFSAELRDSYTLKKGDEIILEIYWSPLTIADSDRINDVIKALNKGDGDNTSLEFALQTIIQKAEDSAGSKLFSQGDRAALRNELPMSILIDIMTKMQGMAEGVEPEAVKSAD